ncbi:soluble NSF attachment protein [Chaetomium sp. MPI-SDFR-AT-0129]|nr:soluble NSF attachment protein [Chaetomium sp. MPI-SDFR-AT-0129]
MALDPRALEDKARKALQGASGGFSFFSNKEEKYQNAADLYVQAANAYRIERLNKEAGDCFKAAAEIHRNYLNEPDDAANQMIDAFKVYRKDYPEEAIKCIVSAIERYKQKGNFRRAASHLENAAELLEEMHDTKRAIQFYSDAGTFYDDDNAKALGNKNWLKVADLSGLNGDYLTAMKLYEKVADASLDNHLMKYSIKDYWLKAGICALASGDIVTAKRNLETYQAKDPTFSGQRECRLLVDLVDALEQKDEVTFGDKLFEYNQMSPLDAWKMQLLVKVKNDLDEAANEFS